MAELLEINQNVGDCGSDGGLEVSEGTRCENIVDVTVDADGQITAFTMSGTGQWTTHAYDTENNTASYNEAGNRQGKKITFDQTASMTFEGVTVEKTKAANYAKSMCCTVWIHYFNSGVAKVQGIDVDPQTGEWKFSKERALVTPSSNSDTSDNADRVEYSITSVGRCLSPHTSLTQAQVEAL